MHACTQSGHQPLFHLSKSGTPPIRPPSVCLGLEPTLFSTFWPFLMQLYRFFTHMSTFCTCTHLFWSPPPRAAIPLHQLAKHPTHLLAQRHFLSHSPSIFINFTPNPSIRPPVCLPTHPLFNSDPSGTHTPIHIHPSATPSIHTHPSIHPPNLPGLCALFCQSICLSVKD